MEAVTLSKTGKIINSFSYSHGKLNPFHMGDKDIIFTEIIDKTSKGEIKFSLEEIKCDECGYKHPKFDLDRSEVYCPKCGLIIQEKVPTDYTLLLNSPWFGLIKVVQRIKFFGLGRFKDPRYGEWRIQVIANAKGKCLKCKKDKASHCHHVLNYSQYPSLKFDVDNGVLLCSDCHELFHIIYGKHDNNRLQLNHFLKTDYTEVFHDKGILGTEAPKI